MNSLAELDAWCGQKLTRLRPRIGTDETVAGVQFTNEPQEVVVELCQHLLSVGWGHLLTSIQPKECTSAREAVAILWRVIVLLIEHSSTETAQGRWSEPRLPSEWARLFGVSLTTLKRRMEASEIHVQKINRHRWRVRLDGLPENRPNSGQN